MTEKSGKLFIKTQGCQMNEYDSSKMADILQKTHGLTLTDSAADADVILLNTCSIREKAQEKVFSDLGRFNLLKKEKPELIIGVGGCVASQEGEQILKRAPYVDLVFGPQTLHRIPHLLHQLRETGRSQVDISFPFIEKFDNLPTPNTSSVTAYVSIMEGCSKYCSFCVVPYTRGEEVSRPLDDVIKEVYTLIQQGVREINLLGQNVNAYRGLMHNGAVADLAFLIQVLSQIEGLIRIRYTTSHPNAFSDTLIEAYKTVPALCDYLHLPVQSGSDAILARMKRGHTVLEYKNKIKRLRAIRPDILISSDFIVGFPGETEADFEATLKLGQEIGFDQSFSFIYSPRPGTPAAEMADPVPLSVKKEWLARLQQQLNTHAIAKSQAMLGTVQQVLIEAPSTRTEGGLNGRTSNYRVVTVMGTADLIGQLVPVKITEVLSNTLRGELI